MCLTLSHTISLVETHALKIAKELDLPVALTASMEDQVQGPLVPELARPPPRNPER